MYWLYHVTVVGLIILCLYLALYFGIFGVFFNYFTLHPSPFTLLLVSGGWIILEYIQANIPILGFGWTSLGYFQYKNLPLIQIADFSGVYGVSFAAMMINVAIYKLIRKSFKEIIIAAMVLALVVSYGIFRINENKYKESIKISVIQGNIPQEVKWDPDAAGTILEKFSLISKMAALDEPDLIIWPETAFPGFLINDKELTEKLFETVKEARIPFLLGANTMGGKDEHFNSAVLISDRGEIVDKYDKIHLVPFGEYVPFSKKFPILHNLVLGELGEFTAGKDFKIFVGAVSDRPLQAKFGVLICFEDIFPELAKNLVKNGAQFLVVITNDAWYGRSPAAYQHAACSAFRAIENRVPIIRCANTGYSCFIDSRGRIYDSVSKNGVNLFVTGYKTSTVEFY